MDRLYSGTLVRQESVSIGQTEVGGVSAGSSASELNQFKRVSTSTVSAGRRTSPRVAPHQSSARRSKRETGNVPLLVYSKTLATPYRID